MGSHHTVTGIIRGYRYCTGTIGGVPGVHLPRRALWAVGGREPALSGLGANPPRAHAPRVWGNPKRGAPACLGGQGNPPWPPPPPQIGSEGPGPLSLAPIYMWGVGGQPHQCSGAALPLAQVLLLSRGAWRSPAGLPRSSITTTPSCCCWTESSPTYPSPLAGSRRGRRHRATRVLNAEAPLFGA